MSEAPVVKTATFTLADFENYLSTNSEDGIEKSKRSLAAIINGNKPLLCDSNSQKGETSINYYFNNCHNCTSFSI